MLGRLSMPAQHQLVEAMEQIHGLLAGKSSKSPRVVLRDPRPGDLGWVVHRQGVLYAQEYGWNTDFEALVAEIVAKFVQEFEPKDERCWSRKSLTTASARI